MDTTTTQPPRSWFRFSLRTMFIVLTVFSLWLGWQAKVVRDRREALAQLRAEGSQVMTSSDVATKVGWSEDESPLPTIPDSRRFLGDVAVAYIIVVRDRDDERINQLRRLFPEAWSID